MGIALDHICDSIVQDIPSLDGKGKQLWRDAMQARLTQMFRHASKASRLSRLWFPEMWRWGVDAVGDVEVEEDEVEGDPPPPPPISQAEPPSPAEGGHATTPPSPFFSGERWFDAQFREHRGAGRY